MIITRPCGCFFRGREFFECEQCREPDEEPMFTNEDRVQSVDDLVATFCARLGVGMFSEDPDVVAGDMIASLLHWVQAKTGKREEALHAARSGIAHYVTESYIDYSAEEVDELGPDSYVTIEVRCEGQVWRTSGAGDADIC